MKRILLMSLLLLGGCHKKHEDGTPVGVGSTLPGSCSTVPHTYTGAVVQGTNNGLPTGYNSQTNHQFVPIAFDITANQGTVNVVLSRPDGTQECFPGCGTGWTNIEFYKTNLDIVNGKEAGFTAYAVETLSCS